MRTIPYLLITLLAVLQALVATSWIMGGASAFTDVFNSFYGAAPSWTVLAFSIGRYWFALPLAGLLWLLLAWRSHKQRRHAWRVAVFSLGGFLSMMYAMYPLHVMG